MFGEEGALNPARRRERRRGAGLAVFGSYGGSGVVFLIALRDFFVRRAVGGRRGRGGLRASSGIGGPCMISNMVAMSATVVAMGPTTPRKG